MEVESMNIEHEEGIVEDGSVDYRGRTPSRATTGAWKAATFIIVMEFTERLCYFGIVSNLLLYQMMVLKLDVKSAAKGVHEFIGVSTMVPLVGGFVADCCLGSFRTIMLSAIFYLLGLSLLTASQTLPSFKPPACADNSCKGSMKHHKILFYTALYLVAVASGANKPALETFGADQFDDNDDVERRQKISFFNWWFLGACSGVVVGVTAILTVAGSFGLGAGYGMQTACMAVTIVLMVAGCRYYRYKMPKGSPLTPILQVFVAAMAKKNLPKPSDPSDLYEFAEPGRKRLPHTSRMSFLDKAAINDQFETHDVKGSQWSLVTVTQVEETKQLISLIPIWLAVLIYGVSVAQGDGFFIKQAYVMDRHITPTIEVPAGTILTIITISMVISVGLYDRLVVPILRRLTGNERGITILQRIGIGIFLSIAFLVAAALVEKKRRDSPVPINFLWLCPQLMLVAFCEIFAFVGLQEFFYGQVPHNMKSLGIGIYLSVFGVSNLLSSILISAVDFLTTRRGQSGWFAEDLNKSKLDYFYWLLALLSTVNLCVFLVLARRYSYKRVEGPTNGVVVNLPDGDEDGH
ncbi:unnamed protein product [Victoria cruziana]